jgi:tetratricopeptide (TPR) repeat protein
MTGQMNFTARMAALHSALWSFDRVYRLSWQVWPASVAVLICGWILFWTPDAGSSSATPWGRPAPAGALRSAGTEPDYSVWPEPLRNDVRTCMSGSDRNVKIEACSRLIGSGQLNGWQLASIYTLRGIHYGDKQPDLALADYDSALKYRPNTPEIFVNRGRIYLNRDQADAAVTEMSKAIALWTPALAANARVYRALAYFMLADYDKATADIDQSQREGADDPQLYLVRGSVYYAQRLYGDSARAFDEYCKRRPRDPVGFVGRGVALEADTKFEKAVLSYETAIILGSTDTLATEGRERAKRRQTCDKGACLNLMKTPGWWDTVGRH